MRDAQRATNELLIKQMQTMTDSMFLSYFALVVGDSDELLSRYIARRLDKISLAIAANEAMWEVDA